jgi:hypothetical protein
MFRPAARAGSGLGKIPQKKEMASEQNIVRCRVRGELRLQADALGALGALGACIAGISFLL